MLQTFLDRFDLSTGAVGTTQARTGYGFTPKLLLGLSSIRTVAAGSAAGGGSAIMSIGACNAASGIGAYTNAAWKILDESGTVTATSNSSGTSSLFLTYSEVSGSTSLDSAWDVSAIGADGFTSRVATDGTVTGQGATVLALGGPAIAQTKIGTVSLLDPPGANSITDVGFAPDAVLFLAATGYGGVSIGAASKRGGTASATSTTFVDVGTSNPTAKSYSRTGECIATSVGGADTLQRGQLTAWLGNGFTLTSLDNPTGTFSRTINYVAIRMAPGFACQVVSTFTNTSTGGLTANLSATGIAPAAGLLVSHCKAESASNTADTDGGLSIGLFSGASSPAQGCISWRTQSGLSSSTSTSFSQGSVYQNMGSGDVLEGDMALTSAAKDQLNFTVIDADPAFSLVWGLVFGSVPRGGGAPIFF